MQLEKKRKNGGGEENAITKRNISAETKIQTSMQMILCSVGDITGPVCALHTLLDAKGVDLHCWTMNF